MVPIKPHTASILPVTQGIGTGANVLGNPALGTEPLTAQCYFEPLNPAETWEIYGPQARSAAIIYCEIADMPKFTLESEVTITPGGNTYVVKSDPEIYNSGLLPDHAVIHVVRLMNP